MTDTPGGTLAQDFSPMGPSFTEFDETPLPKDFSGGFDDLARLTRSASHEEPSPLSGFMSRMSPIHGGLSGVPRSPLHRE